MRFGIRNLLLVIAAVAMVCALYVAGRSFYYAERRHTASVLAEVQGISNAKLHSYIDVVEEVSSISFTVDGHADSVVSMGGLGQYKHRGSFAVSQIGKWRFRIFGKRYGGAYNASTGEPVESNYLGSHIQLGPDSPYKDLIPFEVNTLQDLVEHYAELVELMELWPREAQPGSVTLDDGTTQFFYVIEDGK